MLEEEVNERFNFNEVQDELNDIKKDPFFKKIDWERLIQKRIDPPFVGLGANEKMAKRSDKIVESYEGKTLPYMDKMTYNPDVIDTLASHKESLIKKDSMKKKKKINLRILYSDLKINLFCDSSNVCFLF